MRLKIRQCRRAHRLTDGCIYDAGTDALVYVMPSTSGRTSSHPTRASKLVFFTELYSLLKEHTDVRSKKEDRFVGGLG